MGLIVDMLGGGFVSGVVGIIIKLVVEHFLLVRGYV